jgi:flagellar biosynthesis GTPase FlhF
VRSFARARAGVEKPLLRRGLSAGLVHELTETAAAHVLPLAPRAGLAQAVREALAQRIPAAAPLPASGGSIAFVGAGGSGKTAVCASLLSAYRAASTLAARYGAILAPEGDSEELALLMSPELLRPVAVSSPRALRAVRVARENAFMVLDTPAVSPADRRGVRDLARVLAELEPTRVVIALPATLGLAAAEQLIAGYALLNPAAIALTHADETDQIGVGIEAACRFALPPEFIIERSAVRGWRLSRLDPAAVVAKLLD